MRKVQYQSINGNGVYRINFLAPKTDYIDEFIYNILVDHGVSLFEIKIIVRQDDIKVSIDILDKIKEYDIVDLIDCLREECCDDDCLDNVSFLSDYKSKPNRKKKITQKGKPESHLKHILFD